MKTFREWLNLEELQQLLDEVFQWKTITGITGQKYNADPNNRDIAYQALQAALQNSKRAQDAKRSGRDEWFFRAIVNVIRHELTNYEDELSAAIDKFNTTKKRQNLFIARGEWNRWVGNIHTQIENFINKVPKNPAYQQQLLQANNDWLELHKDNPESARRDAMWTSLA